MSGGRVLLAADDGRPVLTTSADGRAIFCAIDLGSLVWNRAAGVEAVVQVVIRACTP
jgi:hypothetical protein